MNYAPYVRIKLAAELTGYTVKAIEQKIDSGVWAFGEVWKHAPDGSRVIIMEGYRKWVEMGSARPPVRRANKSTPA